jgi:hypothetical protein
MMIDRDLIVSDAALRGGQLLWRGFAKDVKRPESRLRRCLVAAINRASVATEVRFSPEWRPSMPLWPHVPEGKLGGFDLAVRLHGEPSYSIVCELKWCPAKEKVEETPWDCFKLAHARDTLAEVRGAYLIYAAPSSVLESGCRCVELLADGVTSTRVIIDKYESSWRWLLKGSSKSRPTSLPPYVETRVVSSPLFVHEQEQWEIRVVSVKANGQPWYALADGWPPPAQAQEAMDWPHPEPGPGMDMQPSRSARGSSRLPSLQDTVQPGSVPSPTAGWAEISRFALTFDGYKRLGGNETLAELANASSDHFRRKGFLQQLDLDQLRGYLFFEQRRHHHFGHAPDAETASYIKALVEAIRVQTEK